MAEQEGLFERRQPLETSEGSPGLNEDHRELHPILGSMVGARMIEVEPTPMDTMEGLLELEKVHRAVEFVQAWYSPPELTPLERALGPLNSTRHAVDRINNQFATKIIPCLMNPDKDAALVSFRSIIPNTVDEEMVLLTNDTQFTELHSKLTDHLQSLDGELEAGINANMVEIKRADRMQFSGHTTRSLEKMREKGMEITIDPENIQLIKEAHQLAGGGILPLTEYVKNSKVLGVSGFMGSKVSLAVHDYMDHLWTFDMLEKTGILDKYSFMFDSIGNPEATDIYKREGEIVASIAFGVRYFQTMPSAFGPLMRTSQIESHLDNLLVEGQLDSRHMDAYRTLKKMRKGSIDWQSLGFTFSNYITELDQQRRKYGKIKQRDPRTKKVMGELDPMSPDFISFFIDTHQEIMSPKHKHRDDLFRFHILLEEYLTSFAEGKIEPDQPLIIKPSELRGIDYTRTTLPPQRIVWMRNNHGFTATRDAIV